MSSPSPSARGVATAPQPEAAYEAARVLSAGGNAADAAVTGAFVQGVVDPHRCGVGGFGCATVRFGEESVAIDFHGRVGSRARPDQWESIFENAAPDGFGFVVEGKVNDLGYGAITVPGMVAGLGEIHARFGSLPWGDLVRRAIPYARDGFIVQDELAQFWIRPGLHGRVSTRDRLGFTEDGRRICFKEGGATYATGETFRQPQLAATYEEIARSGPRCIYEGELGERLGRDLERQGSTITREDLASYRVTTQPAVAGRYRGHEVHSTPLPGGGVALLQALALAEARELWKLDPAGAGFAHELGLILAAVWHDRLSEQGDPAFGSPSEAHFLTADYVARLAREIARELAPRVAPPPSGESRDTTQLSIVDAAGNAVSFSHSLGYNSGVFAPDTGILYNNCLSAFDPRPGQRNSIAAGKARSTAVAETLVLREGKPWLVLGSPGAARITAGLVQTILAVVDQGLTVAEAVVAPRFDAYDGHFLADSRLPGPVARELEERGWKLIRSPRPFGVVGRVYALETRPGAATIAGVDPGAPGAAYRQSTGAGR